MVSPSSSRSPSPEVPEVPHKRKRQKSASSPGQTETYGLFAKIPKKTSGKKAKLSYEQRGPWEFRTSLSWGKFCALIADHMHCTVTSLDVDSFSWRIKATGAGNNIGDDFGYQQMVSRIQLHQQIVESPAADCNSIKEL